MFVLAVLMETNNTRVEQRSTRELAPAFKFEQIEIFLFLAHSFMGFDKHRESCNCHQNQDMEQSITSPNFVLPLNFAQLLFHPPPCSNSFVLLPPSLPFPKMSYKWNARVCSLLSLTSSLSIAHLRFSHVTACMNSSCLFIAE